jgi:hypothetical protein
MLHIELSYVLLVAYVIMSLVFVIISAYVKDLSYDFPWFNIKNVIDKALI